MRPIRLTMKAFGPYKDKEVIDFTQLDDHSLFVISGNTGAGKTTIFDAICFALYGSASGEDREHHSMLRSHFADPDVHTVVELVFTIHQRTYRILRQLAHIKPGNKTATGEEYEFYEIVDAKEVPVVDRQIVSEINRKVEEIIGLTENQFKQIVMLPQGEFLKLLTSKTENKEAILRRLFKTDRYQQLNELLRQRKNDVKQNYLEAKQAANQYVTYIEATFPKREDSKLFVTLEAEHYNFQQVIEGLHFERDYYLEKSSNDEQIYRKKNKAFTKQQESLYKARVLNEQLTELESKKRFLVKLQEEKENIEKLEETLSFAKRAERIRPYEEQLNYYTTLKEQQQKTVEQLTISVQKTEAQLKQAKEAYDKEKSLEPKRNDMRKKLERLKEFLPFVQSLRKQLAEVNQRQKVVETLKKKIRRKEDELTSAEHKQTELRGKIRRLEEVINQIPKKHQQLINVKETLTYVETYLKAQAAYETTKSDVSQRKTAYQEAQKLYESLEEKWLNNQAYQLAEKLLPGEPCPVCGSKEHPKHATTIKVLIDRETYVEAKTNVEQLQQDYNHAYALMTTYKEQYEQAKKQLQQQKLQYETVNELKKELFTKKNQLLKEIKTLESDQKVLQKKRQKDQQLERKIKELQEEIAEKEKNLSEQKTAFKEKRAVLTYEIDRIPEDVREVEYLEKEIEFTEKELNRLIESFENVEKNYRAIQEESTKLKTTLQVAKKRHSEVIQEVQEHEEKFYEVLKEQQFRTIDHYERSLLAKAKQKELEDQIIKFQNTLRLTKEQVKQMEEQLKGKERIDLEALEQQVEQLKQESEEAFEKWQQAKGLHKEANKFIQVFKETMKRMEQYEYELNIVTDLYDVARGQNDERLSFERFLQIEYLEQIIDAANQRLQRLSKGQFWLRRSERQESHGRQSGLAFDVFDEYTGKVRDVKTLSGGEKFNASLCLALGMSDVIQSFQGNISIETMFIDEGFGTLDEDTLHKAIETLIDLQASGRMIGVISHVQELKTIFPAVLEVSKTKDGYSQTKFHVT